MIRSIRGATALQPPSSTASTTMAAVMMMMMVNDGGLVNDDGQWWAMMGNDAGLWWWAMMGNLEVMYFLKHWQRQDGPEGFSFLILLGTLSQSTSFTSMVKLQIFCKEREIIMTTLTSPCNTFDKSMWQRFQFQQFITNLTNPTIYNNFFKKSQKFNLKLAMTKFLG